MISIFKLFKKKQKTMQELIMPPVTDGKEEWEIYNMKHEILEDI